MVISSILAYRLNSMQMDVPLPTWEAIWNQEREAAGLDQEERHDVSAAIEVGVEAVKRLILADRGGK